MNNSNADFTKGSLLTGIFTTDAIVVQKGFEYLKGFALESIAAATLFSIMGYLSGNRKTVWVMAVGLIQTLLIRLPIAYFMSVQPEASLTKIGLATPISSVIAIILCVIYYASLKEKRSIYKEKK